MAANATLRHYKISFANSKSEELMNKNGSAADIPVMAGTKYTFKIKMVTSKGDSPWSDPVIAKSKIHNKTKVQHYMDLVDEKIDLRHKSCI